MGGVRLELRAKLRDTTLANLLGLLQIGSMSFVVFKHLLVWGLQCFISATKARECAGLLQHHQSLGA